MISPEENPRPRPGAAGGPARRRVPQPASLALLVTRLEPAESFRQGLSEEGFEVCIVDEPACADLWVRARDYDVVVLDQELLRDRCLSALLRWRGQGLRAPVVLLVPAEAPAALRALGLDAGADACLVDPVGVGELTAQVRALLRREEQMHSPVVVAHDLELNTVLRTARRAGRPITLTPREFDLLHILVLHQGKVVTRDMIREYLYDDAHESNVIDVYIGYLRGKIDHGFSFPLILTRWGRGYLFRGERD
jgi:DNA-binding response OmpR family regulator